jgi:hypothetical protein
MGSLPEARLVLRETVIVNSSLVSVPQWQSALGTPRELAAIRVTSLGGRSLPSLPVAFVQAWVLTDGAGLKVPITHASFKAMDTQRAIVLRSWVDPSSELRQVSPPGQLNWGLALRLINRCSRARVEYWQWT